MFSLDASSQLKAKVENLNKSPKKKTMLEAHVDELLEVIDSNKIPCDICHRLFTCKKKLDRHYKFVFGFILEIKVEVYDQKYIKCLFLWCLYFWIIYFLNSKFFIVSLGMSIKFNINKFS